MTHSTTPSANLESTLAAGRVLHVDCDMFFVQVARLEDPEGVGRAHCVIVGGSTSGRGVVTSASYEARAFGVRSGMPTGQALRLCPDATVVGVDRKAVVRRSRAIREVLMDLSPVVQAASIDEFYLDLVGTERLWDGEPLEATAQRIREVVLERTDVSVSIGGATRRIVAKLATNLAKPGGVHIVPPGSEGEFMQRFELREIPGIGPALAASLEKRCLRTVTDALTVEREWLERWFGEGTGAWLHARIRGEDPSRVDPHEPRKSISSERTFFQDIDSDDELERQLLKSVVRVGHQLRSAGLTARTVGVKLRDNDFTTRSAARTVPESIESDAAIYEVARGLLTSLRSKRQRPARLLGVALTHLDDEDVAVQLALFDDGATALETERDRTVSRTMDQIRDRFGDRALQPGRIVSNADRDSPGPRSRPSSGKDPRSR